MTSEVKVRRLFPDAIIPAKQSKGAAAYDIHSYENTTILPNEIKRIKTGIELTIPSDCKASIYSRSGLASKYIIFVKGVDISPCETKELEVVIENKGTKEFFITKGERIAQLVLLAVYTAELTEVNELSVTERGDKGWGSTGML